MPELQPIADLIRVKEKPESTLSLRVAIEEWRNTLRTYCVRPQLREHLCRILRQVSSESGQSFWIQAEYGAGKTHFLAYAAVLLAQPDEQKWEMVPDQTIGDFRTELSRQRIFPVYFTLKGEGAMPGETEKTLADIFLDAIAESVERSGLRGRVRVTSPELIRDWYDNTASQIIRRGVEEHFQRRHGLDAEQSLEELGPSAWADEVRDFCAQNAIAPQITSKYVDRFKHIYDQVCTAEHGYTGMLFIVDEYKSWQERHPEGSLGYQHDEDLLETLGWRLPVDYNLNIHVLVGSQGDVPTKIRGAHEGDRFINVPLLGDRNATDYDYIVSYRCRESIPDRLPELGDYYDHYRSRFKFLKSTSREYFEAVFPFQPRAFEVVRKLTTRVTYAAERSGIHIIYDVLNSRQMADTRRLLTVSDLLESPELVSGLRSEDFQMPYQTYESALSLLEDLDLTEDDAENARRIVATLFLWFVCDPVANRWMTFGDISEAALTELPGLKGEDVAISLVHRMTEGGIVQLQVDKKKGARFTTSGTKLNLPQLYGTAKRRVKDRSELLAKQWKKSLFWTKPESGGIGTSLFEGLTPDPETGELRQSIRVRAYRVVYPGDVIIADTWNSQWGRELTDPSIHFRLVYLTQQQEVSAEELSDDRIVVCMPSPFSAETADTLASLEALQTLQERFKGGASEADMEGRGYVREQLKQVKPKVVTAQATQFKTGRIVTRSSLNLVPLDVFATYGVKRDEFVVQRLLEVAYDDHLFSPQEFAPNRDLSPADVGKVYMGLFSAEAKNAERQARDQFAPGLGLVKKSKPAELNLEACDAVKQLRKEFQDAPPEGLRIAMLARKYCGAPYGLLPEMLHLYLLALVANGTDAAAIQLRSGSEIALAGGRRPAENTLVAADIHDLPWSKRLESAMEKLVRSSTSTVADLIPYFRALDSKLKVPLTREEHVQRAEEILSLAADVRTELPKLKASLNLLASRSDEAVPSDDLACLDRLEASIVGDDWRTIQRNLLKEHSQASEFEETVRRFDELKSLADHVPRLVELSDFLAGAGDTGHPELEAIKTSLQATAAFRKLLRNPAAGREALISFDRFREQYTRHYQRVHRDVGTRKKQLLQQLERMPGLLAAQARLDGISELGRPLGSELRSMHERILREVTPCRASEPVQPGPDARCPACRLSMSDPVPGKQLEVLESRLLEALREHMRRLQNESVQTILRQQGNPALQRILTLSSSKDPEAFSAALTEEAAATIQKTLYAANLRTEPVRLEALLGEFLTLEESQVSAAVKKFDDSLRKKFEEARKRHPGKRIRLTIEQPEPGCPPPE